MTQETSSAPVRIDRIKVVVTAVVAALVVCALGLLVLDHPLTVAGAGKGPDTEVTYGPVIFVSTLAGIAGWGLFYLLERHTRNGRRTWTAIAIGVLVLSLLPVLLGDAEPGTKVTLGIIHVLVGTILIVGLRNTVDS